MQACKRSQVATPNACYPVNRLYGRSKLMAYKHILVAVDLSPESNILVEKAVSMARPYDAKVSLIHVDVNYSDLYTGLID
ncbi:MAG: universal stress protein, partial [Hafnia sp.]